MFKKMLVALGLCVQAVVVVMAVVLWRCVNVRAL
jgi:hypothetical protein